MLSRVYIDTNIVVDICDENRSSFKDSMLAISMLIGDEDIELFINSDTLSNLFYILSNRTAYKSKEVLKKFHNILSIFTLVSIEIKDVKDAIDLCQDSKTPFKDYEDAMQYICAKKVDADLILTNDTSFISLDIEVKSSSEYNSSL